MKNLVKYLSVLGLVILGFLCIMIPSTMKAHAYGENGEMARVYISNGSYTHNGGTINKSGVSGVFLSGGTFNFNGGTITGGDGMISGGGIHMTSGTVNMKGGKITNCMAYYGGGVYMSGGTFNMSSGEIIDNTGYSAHAVDIAGGTFNFSGGKIADNYYGGSTNVQGIRVRSGATFNMSGGTISGHGSSSSDTSNYGVYINEGATFIYNGGTIDDTIYLATDAYMTFKKAPTSTIKIYAAFTTGKIAKLDGITSIDLSKFNFYPMSPIGRYLEIEQIDGVYWVVIKQGAHVSVESVDTTMGTVSSYNEWVKQGTTISHYYSGPKTLWVSNPIFTGYNYISATANEGYEFDYWYVDGFGKITDSTPYTVTSSKSITIKAYFKLGNCTVTIKAARYNIWDSTESLTEIPQSANFVLSDYGSGLNTSTGVGSVLNGTKVFYSYYLSTANPGLKFVDSSGAQLSLRPFWRGTPPTYCSFKYWKIEGKTTNAQLYSSNTSSGGITIKENVTITAVYCYDNAFIPNYEVETNDEPKIEIDENAVLDRKQVQPIILKKKYEFK